MYLEPTWRSKSQLFLFYKNNWCSEKNISPLSQCSRFAQLFYDFNVSLYQPKKDACDTCERFKTGNLTVEEYETHILKKDQAKIEKDLEKIYPTCLTLTMNLQSFLQSLRRNVSPLYHKIKITIHNLTIFNLNTKDEFCFIWNELEGDITSNEFSTIISYCHSYHLPRITRK